MSLRRTSFIREKPTFSGISRALLQNDCSSEQTMDEPIGQPAPAVGDRALAVDPVSASDRILDAVIIAEPSRRRLPPPFGSDTLGSLGARDIVDCATPDEAPRHAFGSGVNDVDCFRTIEQAWGLPLLGRSALAKPITGIWR